MMGIPAILHNTPPVSKVVAETRKRLRFAQPWSSDDQPLPICLDIGRRGEI